MRWLGGISDAMDMNLGKPGRWCGTGKPGLLHFMGSQRVGHDWVTEQQPQSNVNGIHSFGVNNITFSIFIIFFEKLMKWISICGSYYFLLCTG